MNLQLDGLTLPLRLRPAFPLTDLELERFSEGNLVIGHVPVAGFLLKTTRLWPKL